MKIQLHKTHSFWGLMNPKDLKLTLNLTSEKPVSPEIDVEKLHVWEIKQILASLKSKKISISVKPEVLVELIPQEQRGKSFKKAAKNQLAPKAITEKATDLETKKNIVAEVVADIETPAETLTVEADAETAPKVKASKKKVSKKVSKKKTTTVEANEE